MSGHDDQIGQEWTGERLDRESPVPLIMSVIDSADIGQFIVSILAAHVTGATLLRALVQGEHDVGRHERLGCPEHCPRF